jgi:RNA-directed DNA polymerase
MTTVSPPMDEWKAIPWSKIERAVFKLQKRIYRASQRNDVKAVHRLQKLLIKSRSAKCLAVRRVTQDNQGKKTAGIDGVKSLTPIQRVEMVKKLELRERAAPVRRVWIPKPGKNELRGLGIPTLQDRALQTLVKLGMEPEWEARFEANSYGFRPGRSAWDAMAAIYNGIIFKPKWVLDTDIEKRYDRIDHTALLKKIDPSPLIRRQLRAWLKAGVLDQGRLYPTEEGVPQGGTISCLLANIALHGMEEAVGKLVENRRKRPILIRYADDLLVMHSDREIVEKSQEALTEWLAPMGLQLKPSKTRLTHTLNKGDDAPGFDFLGFNIRQYPVGKTKTGSNPKGRPLGFKTIIKPSKESIKRHVRALRSHVKNQIAGKQASLIRELNPVIRGWTRYYSTVCSSDTFSKLSHILFQQLRSWARRRHPRKGMKWVIRKYWRVDEGKGWIFQPRDNGARLCRHLDIPIERHVKVQGTRSPYNGDWIYWSKRLGRMPGVKKRVATLLKRQRGRCQWCGLLFRWDDLMEIDHIIPRKLGGKEAYYNMQLIHRHCHDIKTKSDPDEW